MGNYNIKNIMLGMGVGLIISSMVNISIGNAELSIEEIKKEAAKHDLIVFTKDDIFKKQTQNPIPESAASEGKISISIESGMSSENVADLLKENGLIDDTRGFLLKLEEIGMDKKLKIGNYEIPKGLSNEEIINIIIK